MRGVRGLWFSGLAVLCAAAGALGALSAPASALIAHRYLSQLTEVPAEPGVAVSGPFGAPAGLVSEAGDLYVADPAHNVVDEFSSGGGFVKQIFNEDLEEMWPGVAVDRALGYVYALGGNTLFAFGPAGELVGNKFLSGLNTPHYLAADNSASPSDPAAGDLYLASPALSQGVVDVLKPEPGGEASKVTRLEGTPSGPFGQIVGVAVDEANGDLLVADGEPQRVVDVFKPKASSSPGVPEYEFLFALSGTPGGSFEEFGGVVFESSSGDIYVAARQHERFHGEPFVVDQFSASGAYLDQIDGTPSGPFEHEPPEGVAVASDGDLYVSDTQGRVVDVFSAPLTLPDVSVAASSGVEKTDATLTGTVNPNGQPVSACEFEYGPTPSYGSLASCSPAPGSGSGPVAVTADLAGLAPGTVYHYRVAATGEEGVTEYSFDETVATAPAVEGSVSASGITSFAATLSGVLQSAEVTPEYHFAYGLTSAYGSLWPQPDASAGVGGDQAVSQTVTGLTPDTTYHYALVATNFGGGVSAGSDGTFTTRPLVAPTLSTGGAQEVEGTSATLTGALDPEGLASAYRFEYGPSTSYGSVWPLAQVPAGSGSVSEGVAVAVPNLQPGAVYHYRLVASNEDGTSYGADQTFATPGYPVSAVPEPPVLSTKLGWVNPEAGRSPGKASKPKGKGKKGKGKKQGKHHKAKPRKKGKRKG